MKKTMMNNIFKRFAALALCTGMVTGTALAANTVYKNIRVQYCGIKLVVNGAPVTPKDANGSTVEPFIYNGTTYLPVRAVGNALGQDVSWNGSTKTVYIGMNETDTKTKKLTPYETNGMYMLENDGKNVTMMGKKYTQGLYPYYYGTSYGAYAKSARYSLDGLYKSVEMDIGHQDGAGSDTAALNFYVDGDLVDTYALEPEMTTQHIKVDLKNGLQLKIEGTGLSGYYAFCNITFNK